MNRRRLNSLISLLFALVLVVVVLAITSKRTPKEEPLVPGGDVSTVQAATARPTSRVSPAAPEGNPPPLTPVLPPPPLGVPARPAAPSGLVSSPAQPGPSEPAFLSDDEIAKAIRDKGGVLPVYRTATTDQREDILDYLMAQEKLRDVLGDLLAVETDSRLRAHMLERTVPKGFFEVGSPSGGPEPAQGQPARQGLSVPSGSERPDQELIDLLDAAPASPVGPREWLARLDLASLISDEYGLSMARKARDEERNDPAVQTIASALILNAAQGIEGVPADERRQAEDAIYRSLGPEFLTSDQRVRAYFALFFASDRERARQYLTRQRDQETDPRVLQTLNQLLQRW